MQEESRLCRLTLGLGNRGLRRSYRDEFLRIGGGAADSLDIPPDVVGRLLPSGSATYVQDRVSVRDCRTILLEVNIAIILESNAVIGGRFQDKIGTSRAICHVYVTTPRLRGDRLQHGLRRQRCAGVDLVAVVAGDRRRQQP